MCFLVNLSFACDNMKKNVERFKMKQLDVDVSPPVSIITLTFGWMHWVVFACKCLNRFRVYVPRMCLYMVYIVVNFQTPSFNTF